MARYAICNNQNKVINVIAWDGNKPWNLPPNTYLVLSDRANINYTYDVEQEVFIPIPEKAVPQ